MNLLLKNFNRKIQKELISFKDYLFSLKSFIIFSSLFFLVFILIGYFSAHNFYFMATNFFDLLAEKLSPIINLSPVGHFLIIFLNNSLACFLIIFLGMIFGIFTLFSLAVNGMLIGIVAYIIKTEISWGAFFLGIMPHGIIEVPIIIISAAIGFKLAEVLFNKIFKKEKNIIQEINFALTVFLKIILPLLALAAFIEAFITPLFLL